METSNDIESPPTLKDLREVVGLSREALALEMNVSSSTISRWESGVKAPRFGKVTKLAKFFGISLKEITKVIGFDVSGIPDGMIVDSTLKDLREAVGLSPEVLACQLHVDRTTISSWERGTAIPRTEAGIRLAKFFEVSLKSVANAVGLDTLGIPDNPSLSRYQCAESVKETGLDTRPGIRNYNRRRPIVAQKFNIETDDTSEHMRLMKVARLFDRNYYEAEEIGEIINDGLKTAIKMVHEVNRLMAAERSCLKWIDSKLLYDLSVGSDVLSEVHSTAMIAQAEEDGKKTVEPKNGHVNSEPLDDEPVYEEGMGFLDTVIYTEGGGFPY